MPELRTRQQRVAEIAYQCVSQQQQNTGTLDRFRSFAKSFPALIHRSGLCQAIAFAQAKERTDLLEHVVKILQVDGCEVNDVDGFATTVRGADVSEYLLLSQRVLLAAVWIKRYVEAFEKSDRSD